MENMTHIQTEIVNIINSHHTILAVDDGNSVSSSDASVVEYNYEARVFYTDDNTTTMINYFRIKDPCNFDYFKSILGWEQKNNNYVPVKYNCENDSTNDDFICRNGDKPILDNDTNNNNPSVTSLPPAFIMANIERNDLVDAQIDTDTQIEHLGLKLENGNIYTKKFFSVVTPINELTTICGFHTADNANGLKIQFFDTTAGKYILKYNEQNGNNTSASTDNMTLILCKISNGGGGGKRKKKTPSARSKKRSKTSQTKTLKKH